MGSFLDQLKNTFKSTQEMSVVMPNLKEFVEGFGTQFGLDNVFVTMEGSRTGVSHSSSICVCKILLQRERIFPHCNSLVCHCPG